MIQHSIAYHLTGNCLKDTLTWFIVIKRSFRAEEMHFASYVKSNVIYNYVMTTDVTHCYHKLIPKWLVPILLAGIVECMYIIYDLI